LKFSFHIAQFNEGGKVLGLFKFDKLVGYTIYTLKLLTENLMPKLFSTRVNT